LDEDIKSNKNDIQAIFSKLEKIFNEKIDNLSEAFMKLKIVVRRKNKETVKNILINQLEYFGYVFNCNKE
jgi:hypothetical protein